MVILIASPLQEELFARIRAVDPGDDVHYRSEALASAVVADGIRSRIPLHHHYDGLCCQDLEF